MEPQLWSIAFSPWSIRVKWALRTLKYPFQVVEYVVPMSERRLRQKLQASTVSVPVLFTPDSTITDGIDIVRHAAATSPEGGDTIFVDGVEDWVALADETMEMMR